MPGFLFALCDPPQGRHRDRAVERNAACRSMETLTRGCAMDTDEWPPPVDPEWDDRVRKATPVVYGGVEQQGQVQKIPCGSWSDFCEKVRFSHIPFMGRVFRGQRDPDWELQSKWDRFEKQKRAPPPGKVAMLGRKDTPESFLARFKSRYIGTSGFDTSSLDKYEWMALARHHGLITPLLDWTESPYVAAFFAFRELLPVDRDLGCLNPSSSLTKDAGSVSVWQLPHTGIIENFEELLWVSGRHDFAARQRAQSGHFTLLESSEHHSLREYLESKNYVHLT